MQDWLDTIALVDGPAAALDRYIKLLEFAVPKLSRAEVAVEDGSKTKKAEFTMRELQDMLVQAQAESRTIDGEATDVTPNSDQREVP